MSSSRMRGAALLLAAVAAFSPPPRPPGANTVTDWNIHATNSLITTAGQGPTVSTIHLAMVHGAVFDAVNAIDRRYEPYLSRPRARRWYSKDAAAATAAYRVLLSIVPTQQPTLDAHYATSLAAIPDGRRKSGGIATGEIAAATMIGVRTGDGRFGPYRFDVGTEPGQWRPVLPAFGNDPNAWVAQVKPFLLESGSQFRTDGPHALDSRRYAREFQEVKEIGSLTSATRSADQTDAALFWSEGPAIWTRVARDLTDRYGLGIADTVPAVRNAVPDRGRLPHRYLGRQGQVAVLAADHGHPRGRARWKRGHRGGRRLASVPQQPALSRPALRPLRRQQRDGGDASRTSSEPTGFDSARWA